MNFLWGKPEKKDRLAKVKGSLEMETIGSPTADPVRRKVRDEIIARNNKKREKIMRLVDGKKFKDKAWWRNDPTNDQDESLTENPGLLDRINPLKMRQRYLKLERQRKRERNRLIPGFVYPGSEKYNKMLDFSKRKPERVFYSGEKLNSGVKRSYLKGEKNRGMKQNCKKVVNIPRAVSICWFQALLMVIFYSQNMRKLMLAKIEAWEANNIRGTNTSDQLYYAKKEFYGAITDLLFSSYDFQKPDFTSSQKFQRLQPNNLLRLINLIYPTEFSLTENVSVRNYIKNLFALLNIRVGFFVSDQNEIDGWDNIYVDPTTEMNYKKGEAPISSDQYTSELSSKEYFKLNESAAEAGYDVIIVDNLNSNSILKSQVLSILNGLLKLNNPFFKQFQADLGQNRIQLGRTDYVKDAVFFSGLPDSGQCQEKQFVGITCNNKSYIYNAWIPKQSVEYVKSDGGNYMSRDNLPCEIVKYDWKNNKEVQFSLNRKECRLQSAVSRADDMVINLGNRFNTSRHFVFVREDYAFDYKDNVNVNVRAINYNTTKVENRSLQDGKGIQDNIYKNRDRINVKRNDEKKIDEKKIDEKAIKSRYILDDVNFSESTLNCIRQVSNWSKLENKYKFSFNEFDQKQLLKDLPVLSPKMQLLLDNIKKLDEKDMQEHGHHFKHFIFSGLERGYGAPIICSALQAAGYEMIFDKNLKVKSYSNGQKDNRFALVTNSNVYNKTYPAKLKNEIFDKIYNDRENNVHGEVLRFIVLDNKFKENIDLFEVRHVHIFEPQMSKADTTQVIGRATRKCGQMKLNFSPTLGWPLYVKIYDTKLPNIMSESMRAKTLHELYEKNSNINLKDFVLTDEINKHCIMGSVDYSLNYELHMFGNKNSSKELNDFPEDGMRFFQGGPSSSLRTQNGGNSMKKLGKNNYSMSNSMSNSISNSYSDAIVLPQKKNSKVQQQDKKAKRENELELINKRIRNLELAEEKEFQLDRRLSTYTSESAFVNFRNYVNDNFDAFKWKNVVLENDCDTATKQKNKQQKLLKEVSNVDGSMKKRFADPRLIDFSPSQNFIRNYFHPTDLRKIKGMLIYHSTGTGKTCLAISAATTNFEKMGYSILWVTRKSIKSYDFGGNMYKDICNMGIRTKIKAGEIKEFEKDEGVRNRKYLGDSWKLPPMSYKTFTNAIGNKNEYHSTMMKMNDAERKIDPLRKTLIIIDEAHKLYSEANDLVPQETPDLDELYRGIMNSYKVSGKESCRVMLLTATPIVKNPLEIVKLINLLKPEKEALPTSIQSFQNKYLDTDWKFHKNGSKEFLNSIAGHISYLNQTRYPGEFAQPVIDFEYADMSLSNLDEESELSKHGILVLEENKEEFEKNIENNEEVIRNFMQEISVLKSVSNTNNQISIIDYEKKIKELTALNAKHKKNIELINKTVSKQKQNIKNKKNIDMSQESILLEKCLFPNKK